MHPASCHVASAVRPRIPENELRRFRVVRLNLRSRARGEERKEAVLADVRLLDGAVVARQFTPNTREEERQIIRAFAKDAWVVRVLIGLGKCRDRHEASAATALVLADDYFAAGKPRGPMAARGVADVRDEIPAGRLRAGDDGTGHPHFG